jgi:hypothetical protein
MKYIGLLPMKTYKKQDGGFFLLLSKSMNTFCRAVERSENPEE